MRLRDLTSGGATFPGPGPGAFRMGPALRTHRPAVDGMGGCKAQSTFSPDKVFVEVGR